MARVVSVKALEGFKIEVAFQDGAKGTVDLSDLAGKGVFARWSEAGFFESVFVDEESHAVAWPGGIDLSPESLYEDVTGRKPLDASRA